MYRDKSVQLMITRMITSIVIIIAAPMHHYNSVVSLQIRIYNNALMVSITMERQYRVI